jgi:GR25 family glycosyltransferase involved in LPS biosynthesis
VVLEDDAVLTDAILPFLASDVLARHKADILKLETRGHGVLLGHAQSSEPGIELRELQSSHMGTAAYVISQSTAAASIADPLLAHMAIDRFMFGKGGRHLLSSRILQATPSPAIQLDRLGLPLEPKPAVAVSDLVEARRRHERERRAPTFGEILGTNLDHAAKLVRLLVRDPGVIGRKRQRIRFTHARAPALSLVPVS